MSGESQAPRGRGKAADESRRSAIHQPPIESRSAGLVGSRADVMANSRSAVIEVRGLRRWLVAISDVYERSFSPVAGTIMFLMLWWTWFPIVELALLSVNKAPFRGIPNGNVTGGWYSQLFSNGDVSSSLRSSIWIALLVGLLTAIISFGVGREFRNLRRKGLFVALVVLPILVPGLLFGFALLIYTDLLGIVPGELSVVWAHVSWALPFGFLAMLITYVRLDKRWLDAAADLGATPWRALRDIEFPLVRTGVVAAFLFGFLLSFNELVRSIFVSGAVTTLPLYVWAHASAHSSTVPLIYALATLITLASLVLIGVAFWLLFRGAQAERYSEAR